MSVIGKYVELDTVNGIYSGTVVRHLINPFDEHEVWYELDSGWTVNERHVVAAKWEARK